MIRAFRFRIYPKKNQEVILTMTLTTCRHLYNNALAERKREAELNRLKKSFDIFPWGKPQWISYKDQAKELAKSKNDFQKQIHSQVLQNTLRRLDRSFKNFFSGYGYPRFQGRERYNSFTYPQSGFSLKDGVLTLSKIGNIRNQRKDFAHQVSRTLVDTYDHIVFENLRIKNMMQNHHLAKSISDAGWYQLMQFTKSKAECAGKIVEFVNPAGTSQTCLCGCYVPKDLSIRIHSCPSCGLVMPRDQVSAILIENRYGRNYRN
ncbi:MAG: hypothetical protein C3F06_04660 [Candidatus Methanoperedenaceae archaeon]|nr:MAG: hypothetical protein C3F06_04660 [Candidatus Methanoperedenaceae archaeon]